MPGKEKPARKGGLYTGAAGGHAVSEAALDQLFSSHGVNRAVPRGERPSSRASLQQEANDELLGLLDEMSGRWAEELADAAQGRRELEGKLRKTVSQLSHWSDTSLLSQDLAGPGKRPGKRAKSRSKSRPASQNAMVHSALPDSTISAYGIASNIAAGAATAVAKRGSSAPRVRSMALESRSATPSGALSRAGRALRETPENAALRYWERQLSRNPSPSTVKGERPKTREGKARDSSPITVWRPSGKAPLNQGKPNQGISMRKETRKSAVPKQTRRPKAGGKAKENHQLKTDLRAPMTTGDIRMNLRERIF